MKPVRLSPRARTDLEEIWIYIARDSSGAADRFLDRIYEMCQKLAHAPGMGRRREELGRDLRSFPVGSQVIFYRRAKAGIEVVRVLSGCRDLDSLFDE